MRGSVYGEAGQTDQALADFTKAISLDPNYAQAYANRGLVYRKSNQLDLALADFNKALSIDPNYAPAYVGRGSVYSQQGRHEQALADFNKAIALKPDNAEAYYSRGMLYQSQHQHQLRDRRFLDRAWAHHAENRDLCRARPELSGRQQQQGGGGRSRPGGAGRSAKPQSVDGARPRLRTAWRQGQGRRLLCQGSQHQRKIRARENRICPGRRPGRPVVSDVLIFQARVEHDLFGKPVSTHGSVRGHAFPDHALVIQATYPDRRPGSAPPRSARRCCRDLRGRHREI